LGFRTIKFYCTPITHCYIRLVYDFICIVGGLFHFQNSIRETIIIDVLVTTVNRIGMLSVFPFQGYGAVPQPLSSLQHFCLPIYCCSIADGAIWKIKNPSDFSYWFKICTDNHGDFYYCIWAMGAVIGKGMQATPWYHIVVQFYLHFNLNGWFLEAIFGLLLFLLNQWGVQFTAKSVQEKFFLLYWVGFNSHFCTCLGWAFKADFYIGSTELEYWRQLGLLLYFNQLEVSNFSEYFKIEMNKI